MAVTVLPCCQLAAGTVRPPEAGWGRGFVKPAYGSSTSGALTLRFAQGRAATTSVEMADDGRLFNLPRIHTYDDERTIGVIVDRLAPEGLYIERWFPKAGLDGRVIDLRALVVAGEPGHLVVRASRTPLTNLRLGDTRGRPHAGVDMMIGVGWRRYAVAEANAFGDLLPGIVDTVGQDSYTAQLDALQSGRFAAWRATRPAAWAAPDGLESAT